MYRVLNKQNIKMKNYMYDSLKQIKSIQLKFEQKSKLKIILKYT